MIEITPVGSRVTCDPPPTDTDEDYLVYTDDTNYGNGLVATGWISDSAYPGENFTSYKRGTVNYIVTHCEDFRDKFILATKVAKTLNLLKKEERVVLFQAILYGNG